MKLKTVAKILEPFIASAIKDKDHYLIFHFSMNEEAYGLYYNNLDLMDARIIIRNLVELNKIPLDVLREMLISEQEPERSDVSNNESLKNIDHGNV